MTRLCIFLCILGSSYSTGCAYNFGAVQRKLPADISSISVPIFSNSTQETGIEVFFTRAMIEEITRSKSAKVVSKKSSDTYIEGKINSVILTAGAIIRDDNTNFNLPLGTVLRKEYSLSVKVEIYIRNKLDDSVIWYGTFDGEDRFPAPVVTQATLNTVNPLYLGSVKERTIQNLAKVMMEEAFDRITENF